MRITIIAMLATGLLGLSATLFAAGELPARGMTQDAVRAKFGAPSRQVAPVGSPPISRWIYDDFTVYFEGKYSLHTVSHSKTLTTPEAGAADTTAPAAVEGSVDALPPIDEIDEPGEQAAETAEPAEQVPAENSFRFDPATGRIIEIGPDGKAIQSPTSQPGSSAPLPSEPAPADETDPGSDSKAVTPVVAPASAPASAPAGTGTGMRFDPATGRMIEVGPDGTPVPAVEPAAVEPAAAEPAPAAEPESAAAEPAPAAEQPATTPAEAPAAEPATGRFRFDPATGRIVMDSAEPTAEPAAEPAADAPATEKPADEPAATEPAAEDTVTEKEPPEEAPEDNGFSIQW